RIDAAYANGGGIVWVQPGKTFKIASSLTLKDKVWIVGSMRGSIIHATGNFPLITVATTAFNAGVAGVTLKGAVGAGSSQVGLDLAGNASYWGLTVRDVWIQDCGGIGFKMGQYVFSPV